MPVNSSADYFFDALHNAYRRKKTGVLTATNKSDLVTIFVKDGIIVHATGFQDKILLGYLLRNKGLITDSELDACLDQARQNGQSLGKTLVENGHITFETLSMMIRKQAVLTIAALLIWPAVNFEFKPIKPNENAILPVQIDMIDAIYEAVRRIEKMSIVKRYLPDPTMVYLPGSLFDTDAVSLTPGETTVLRLADGRRTITRIITDSAMDGDTVYRCLLTLLATGKIAPVPMD